MLCAKNTSKNTKHSKNETILKNRPSCKGYSPCMDCSLCKMVSLGHKLKMQKRCGSPLYKNTRVVLCKKTLEETPNIREMRPFGKSAILQRLWPKMVSVDQNLKMLKTCERPFYKNTRVVLCKKVLEKTPNIQEKRRF